MAKKTKRTLRKTNEDVSVRSNWKRIQKWLTSNALEYDSSLCNGERVGKIRELETRIGRKFPNAFIESLRLYSQSKGIIPDPSGFGIGYNHSFGLMPLDEIYRRWKMLTDLFDLGEFDSEHERVKSARGVVRQWWSASWVPFAANGGGDYYCLDLGPTWPGTRGQLVFFSHECEHRPLIADSFLSFTTLLADGYESGNYTISESAGVTRKKRSAFPNAKDR